VDVEDGRRFLTRSEREWDVIALDAFYSDAVPFHLTTLEFAELAHERLAPGGVLVANIVGALRGPSSKLFRSLVRTYRAVFPTVLVHPVFEPGETAETDLRNIIVVATDRPATDRAFVLRRLRELRAQRPRLPDLSRAVRQRDDRVVPTRDVPVLTDDYAPTDSLLLID
jgi:spermidine synthase